MFAGAKPKFQTTATARDALIGPDQASEVGRFVRWKVKVHLVNQIEKRRGGIVDARASRLFGALRRRRCGFP
jgi:hypothetical protein